VDAVVTDPPYGLSFMGKKWDYDVPAVAVWEECLRVLKPGGHLLAFAGTRTQHRMAVRIEDAGFEIRDMIAWVYGSGFPKSLDVSKAIDKADAVEEQTRRRLRFTSWVRSTGITARQIDEATGTQMGGHYTACGSQPAIMTREHLEACRQMLGDVPDWVEREADVRSVESRNFAERDVVAVEVLPDTSIVRAGFVGMTAPNGVTPTRSVNITAPFTSEARKWQGWGTALKPSMEPITVARKPLDGTVAANVLEYGTGALNIDGTRVGTRGGTRMVGGPKYLNTIYGCGMGGGDYVECGGRWPANLIHDGSAEVVEHFPAETGESAARFFYCAKADGDDRDSGVAGVAGVAGGLSGRANGSLGSVTMRRNVHPTVKPVDLMCYLCRLVVPPGGVVLDPFMGSGSTGKAAGREGFRFVGFERERQYCEIAVQRLVDVAPLFRAMDGGKTEADGTDGTDGTYETVRAGRMPNPDSQIPSLP
jgi:hypothetical protein